MPAIIRSAHAHNSIRCAERSEAKQVPSCCPSGKRIRLVVARAIRLPCLAEGVFAATHLKSDKWRVLIALRESCRPGRRFCSGGSFTAGCRECAFAPNGCGRRQMADMLSRVRDASFSKRRKAGKWLYCLPSGFAPNRGLAHPAERPPDNPGMIFLA